jgi:hypothetical protein
MTGYVLGTVLTGRLVGITMVEFVGLAGHQEMVHTCAWTTIDCGIDLRPVVYSGQSALTRRSGVFQPGLSRDCSQRNGLRQKPRDLMRSNWATIVRRQRIAINSTI